MKKDLSAKQAIASPARKWVWAAFLFVVFFVSTALLAYASLLLQLERGNRALRSGEIERAEAIYEAAEAPFHKIPWLAQLLKSDFKKLIFNQLGLFYAGDRDEELIEKLEQGVALAPFLIQAGEYYFWSGNLLLRRAARSRNPETMLKALKDAREAYRKGLEIEPDDWDLKYNYELVQTILTQKGPAQEKEEKTKSILEKMRPPKRPAQEELPPEKRG